jgi:RNA-directed DNA polymerase
MSEQKASAKPFCISRAEVWDAWVKVRGNKGAAGVDGQSIAGFEKDLKNNLYRIWNRMSSGTYFPPAVKAVPIPKKDGGTRILGVPTVGDRVAQTVVAAHLTERLEPVFHPDSYGYRPGRSALQAVETCRERCWRYDWIIEFDIRKFFDTVPWDKVIRAVEAHTDARWVVLYVRRWLAAGLQLPDGSVAERDQGTPQGSSVSPVLANLFLHYAFDMWLTRNYPAARFERYADDGVIHCRSQREAEQILAALAARMAEVGLELHPGKTTIVYCKDSNRRGGYPHTEFTFLAFTFRPRGARNKHGVQFTSFLPAISRQALKKLSETVRSWRLHRRTGSSSAELAALINRVVRGWMNYYGRFYRSALYPLFRRINTYLLRWTMKKYKKLRTWKKSIRALGDAAALRPKYFAHWDWVKPAAR